jgi:hypothetical protein
VDVGGNGGRKGQNVDSRRLLAGDGLLMVVNRVRFALFGLRVLSTLCVASLDGMVALLMNAHPFLPFRSSLDGCRSVMDLDSSRMRN